MYLQLTIPGLEENTSSLTDGRNGEYVQVMTEGVMGQTTRCSPKIILNTGI